MTPLPNRFPILRVVAIGALALLVAMLALIHPASAEDDDTPCATGGAVEDAANNPGLVSDCEALLAARDTLAGSATLNWSASTSIGQWVGVTVASSPLRVTELRLGWAQVIDVILPLPEGVSSNYLSGEIPSELGSLADLEVLDLRGNDLTGEIPSELGSLAGLEVLYLDRNDLTGEIPPELGSLTNLWELDLGNNRLSGVIPPELGHLANLEDLFLGSNRLSGQIPSELGSLAYLLWLGLDRNQLTGEIPPELGSLADLRWLDLDRNQLTGEIPPELGSLSSLQRPNLSHNQLTGEIPPELGSLADLRWLDLDRNQLSGGIPSELGSLADLWWLDLSDNQLSGEIPSELGSLADLALLDLSRNDLSGEIPSELGSLANLRRLYLSLNELSGEIPSELGSLANLRRLYLQGNRLSGCIPEGLRDVASNDLEDLDLPFCASRSIREDAAEGSNVGNPVVATDDDEGDTLTYTLGGADADSFDIDSSTGQITVGDGTQLDYETKDRYDVTVTATDPSSGASGTMITVTIMVTDVRVSEDAAVNAYDANTNETIEKSEVIDAILDYLNYEIEKGIVLDLIGLYFGPTLSSTPTLGPSYSTAEIPPCTPVPGSPIDPCEPDVALISGHGFEDIGLEPWSVRSYLDDVRGKILVGHLVVRGTYIPGTVRCIADNTVRYPSYTDRPNKSVLEGVSAFKCYADVRVNAYVVGSGPSTLTVLVWPFGYWSNATPEAIERLRSSYERVFIEGEDDDIWWITVPAGGIGGREAILSPTKRRVTVISYPLPSRAQSPQRPSHQVVFLFAFAVEYGNPPCETVPVQTSWDMSGALYVRSETTAEAFGVGGVVAIGTGDEAAVALPLATRRYPGPPPTSTAIIHCYYIASMEVPMPTAHDWH